MELREKYLAIILSLLLPSLNILSQNSLEKEWNLFLPQFAIGASFLYIIWQVNAYFRYGDKESVHPIIQSLGIRSTAVLSNILVVSLYIFVIFFVLKCLISIIFSL